MGTRGPAPNARGLLASEARAHGRSRSIFVMLMDEDADPPRVRVLQTHTGAAFEAGRIGSGGGERLGNVATAMEAAATCCAMEERRHLTDERGASEAQARGGPMSGLRVAYSTYLVHVLGPGVQYVLLLI